MKQLKIGLFSLRDGVGCTRLSIHIANYFAGSDNLSVALIEKISGQRESEFTNVSMKKSPDGTFMVNNVYYYPADVCIPINETVCIYDIGTVNAVYKFDEDYDKLYLCTDSDVNKIEDILQFKNDTGLDFDCVLFGASRNQVSVYAKSGLRAILVGDKREERLDYNFYLALSQVVRRCGLVAPEYHKDWTYAEVKFEGYTDPEESNSKKKKRKDKKTKIEKKEPEIIDDVPDISSINTKQSVDSYSANVFGFDFGDIPAPDFSEAYAPEPYEEIKKEDKEDFIDSSTEDFSEDFDTQKEIEEELNNSEFRRQLENLISKELGDYGESDEVYENENNNDNEEIIKLRNELERQKALADKMRKDLESSKESEDIIRQQIEEEAKRIVSERLSKVSSEESKLKAKAKALADRERELNERESSLRNTAEMIPTRAERNNTPLVFSPIPVNPSDRSIYAQALNLINKEHKDLCNIFLVTKSDNLFIFSNVITFTKKLAVLKREIRNVNNIRHFVLTYKDATKAPVILTDGKKEDVFALLSSLDAELREKSNLTDDDIRCHKELLLFNEILYTS